MSGHKNRSTPHKNPQNKAAPSPATTATTTAAVAATPSALATIQEALRTLDESKLAHNHRNAFRSLTVALTGKEVSLDLADGSVVSGVLYAACLYKSNPKRQIVVKGCKLVKAGSSARTFTVGSTLIFDYQDIVCLWGTPGDLYPARASAEFRTDSATKKGGSMKHLEGRELQSVANSWLDPSTQTSLTSSQGSDGAWDQFETNRRLFNVKDTFDENLYTKALDMSKMTAEQIARAERLAREIESENSSNIHLQEERGQLGEREIDEEALYSGVIRSDYTPNMSGTKPAPAAKEATGVNAPSWRKPSPGGSHLPENNVWRSRPAVVADPAPASSSASVSASQKGKPAPAPAASKAQSQQQQPAKKDNAPPGFASKAGAAANKAAAPASTTAAPAPTPAPAPAVASLAPPAAAAAPAETAAKADTTAEKAKETAVPAAAPAAADAAKEAAKEAPKEKPKLNPNAKEFVMNVNAREFVPSFVAPTPPPAVPVAVPPAASLLLTPPPAPPTGFTPPAPGAFAPAVLPLTPAVQLPPTPSTPGAVKSTPNVHLPLPPLTPATEAAPLAAMPTPPNFGTLDSAAFLANTMPPSTILPPSPMVDSSLAAKISSPPPAIAPLTPSHAAPHHAHAHMHMQHSPAPAGVLAPPTLMPQMQGFPPHSTYSGAPMQMGYYQTMPMPAVPPANPYYNAQMDPQMTTMASNVNMGMYPPPMGYQSFYPQQGFMPQMAAAPMPYPSHPPAPYYHQQGYPQTHENKGGRFPGGGYQGGRKGDGHGRFGSRGRGNPRHQYNSSHSDAQQSQAQPAQPAQSSEQAPAPAAAEAAPAAEPANE